MLGNNEFLLVLAAGFTSAWLLANGWTISGLVMFLASISKFRDIRGTRKVETPEGFHVVIIGSGVSGICIAKRLTDLGIKYTILEKSSDLGGTWWDNKYPGVACDVASHLYSYSFFLNPTWSRAYSKGAEIHQYLKKAASSFGVYPNVKLNKRVASVVWDEKSAKWTVTTTDGSTYVANIVISGAGALHVPKLPDFKGMDTFKGPNFHTALWDTSFNPKGKKVAVVGTGASAVQVVPGLVNEGISELKVFQRTPSWVPPRLDRVYPEWVKTLFTIFPILNTLYRYSWFWMAELRFRLIFTESAWITRKLSGYIHHMVKSHYYKVLKDKELCKKLIPNFSMGCKRITPSDHYLQAFNREDVHLVTDKIAEITETGVKTEDGVDHEVDAIVYATGFDLQKSARPFIQLGKDGKSLSDTWGDAPSAYYGITHHEQPNYFILLGPSTGLGHNSIIYMIECQVNYTVDAILKLIKSKARWMAVRKQVVDDYLDWTQKNMKGKVFADNSACVGWYRNSRGVNWTLWPLDLVSYWWFTRKCDMQDYQLVY